MQSDINIVRERKNYRDSDRVKERGEKKRKRKLRRKTIDLSTNAHPRSTQLTR